MIERSQHASPARPRADCPQGPEPRAPWPQTGRLQRAVPLPRRTRVIFAHLLSPQVSIAILVATVFGALFPLSATVLECLLRGIRPSFHALIFVQRTEPLLWIIDTAPVVLGLAGYVVGRRRLQLTLTLRRLKWSSRMHREASEAKSEFLARISHELRTPLNGVIGMTEMAIETTRCPNVRAHLDISLSAASSLLLLIDEILGYSEIEAGRVSIEQTPFDLRLAVRGAAAMVQQDATDKGLQMVVSIDPELPDALVGDATRIRQVLCYLLTNAVKFTDRGSISLRVDCLSRSEENADLRFEVQDTGIGIAPELRRVIIQPFSQGERYATRTRGGSGLGLTVARELVSRMGGSLDFSSTEGEGSTFFFSLTLPIASLSECPVPVPERACPEKKIRSEPADLPCHTAIPIEMPATSTGLEILLAEDNPVNRKIAVRLLEKWGHRVQAVEDGEYARQAATSKRFDLILMDIQMPRMNGIEATLAIRIAERQSDRRTPIIALTAHTDPAEKDRCLAAGMDAVLTKPIDKDALEQAVADSVRQVVAP